MGYLTKGIISNDFESMKKDTVDGALDVLRSVSNELSLAQVRSVFVICDS